MKRFLVLLSAFVITADLSTGAQSASETSVAVTDARILHVLQRMTFGPRPGDIESVRQTGLESWIRAQLQPEGIAENPTLEDRLKTLTYLNMSLSDSANYVSGALMTVNVVGGVPIVVGRMGSATPDSDLKAGKLFRAVYSNRQLQEVLVDFWFNHFNVNVAKGSTYVANYEREAIRPYVLGKFEDMLVATALHPAMLKYLDNTASIAPEISQPNGPNFIRWFEGSHGLNENFSRELMELHTLGVDGGYTQADIEFAARCFTGMSFKQTAPDLRTGEPAKAEVLFSSWAHDPKDKVVLGHTISARGPDEVYELLHILATHPSTARHISKQLAERFVSDTPPEGLVNRMAKSFMESEGDLKVVMTVMLTSPEFLSIDAARSKTKSPLDYVVSSIRAVDANMVSTTALDQWLSDMGERLYGKIEPTGYPNTGESWINSYTLLVRANFALSLANGKIAGVNVDANRWEDRQPAAIARELLGRDGAASTMKAINNGKKENPITADIVAGLILGSPDFQRK